MAVFPVDTTCICSGKEYPATANVVVEYSCGAPVWFVGQLIVWCSQVGGAVLNIYDSDIGSPRALRKMTVSERRSAIEHHFRRLMGPQYDDVIRKAWLMAKPASVNEEVDHALDT